MTAAVSREHKIVYGTLTVGDTSDYLIHGPIRLEKSFDVGTLSFQVAVLLQSASLTDFLSACDAVEAGFRQRRVAMTWTQGGQTRESWSHSGNTGFNSEATCVKAGTIGADSGRSVLYDVTIRVGLPADDTGGRRDVSMEIVYDTSNRRTVRFAGAWTAEAGTSASANYAADIATYCTSRLPSGTFEIVGESTREDDQNKILTFDRTYLEILDDQSAAGLDHASIKDQRLKIVRVTARPGDTYGGTKRLEGFAVEWSCSVDKTVTQDLGTLYTGTIMPYILQRLRDEHSMASAAVIGHTRALDPVANRIQASLEVLGVTTGTDYVQSMERTQVKEEGPWEFNEAWGGGIYDAYADSGHATRLWVRTRETQRLGTHSPVQRINGPVKRGAWHLIANDSTVSVATMGDEGYGDRITASTILEVEVWRYVTTPAVGGGGSTAESPRPGQGGPGGGPDTTPPADATGGGSSSGGLAVATAPNAPPPPAPGLAGLFLPTLSGAGGSVVPGIRPPGSA